MTQDRSERTAPRLSEAAASGTASKIRSLDDLGACAEAARKQGRKVVLAHGVFDLLHMGHVRHLEEARSHGDVLIVTLTADAYVNKGPGKPVFPAALRAEMLAALSCVDFVGINDAPDAEPVLHAVKPSVYAKGSDYANPDDDVTGKILAEREAVETYGGRLAFTGGITFSSSELLNRHFQVFEPQVHDFLSRLRDSGGLAATLDLIERVKDMRVLLVGDTIVDEYRYVVPLGKSPKENMIATRFEESETFAGGVVATANHVAGLCKQVDVMTCLGGVDSHEGLIRQSLRPNVRLLPIRRRGAPTTRKVRFIDHYYFRKLFEVYHFDDRPLSPALQRRFDTMIAEKAADYDLVLVNDFGHGLIARSTIETLCAEAKFLAVNAQTNSANAGFNLITRYPRADLVCIDMIEAQLAVGDKFIDPATVVGRTLPGRIDCDRVIMTLGKSGSAVWERGALPVSIPAFAKAVVDLVGAGDAFLAVSAPLAAAGGSMRQVGFVGNVAGAIKVGIVGHRSSIDKATLIKSITGLLK
ncbi:MAG: PfkB family carbohydrate kinase [Alphaproteobacteria bacterium]